MAKNDKLTIAEKIKVKDLMLSDDPNEIWLQAVADSTEMTKAMTLDPEKVKKLKDYRDKVRKGEKTCKRRINGKWVTKVATMADVQKAFRFKYRWFYDDPLYADDIMMKLRCPLDGHLYKSDFGSDSDE
jgi:hypothetical protein